MRRRRKIAGDELSAPTAWSFGACVAPDTPLPLPGVAFFEAAVLYLLALVHALRAFEPVARAVRAA